MWDVRYRPLRFADVLGQPGNVRLLRARLEKGSAFDTNYIFSGGHGQGKTTLARIHARAMLCQQLDKSNPEPCNECDNCRDMLNEQPGAFVERDAASQGTIEHIRALVDELPFAVFNAQKRIHLFDEAHRMSAGAQDVLLKPLEEKQMVGIFCTTEPEKIRGPIRSRCEEYVIRKVTREDILARMKMVLTQEGVEHQDDAVLIVIDYSGGHVRDVLNRLEMIAQTGPVTVESVREYLRLSVVSLYYYILLALPEPKKALELVDLACESESPEELAVGLAEAAMNSYRVANNMYADFSFVDKTQCLKVYEKYGAHVMRFADWFLRHRYTNKVALLRDILIFGATPGNLPSEGAQAPVVFMVGGPATACAPVVQTAAPTTNPTPTSTVSISSPTKPPKEVGSTEVSQKPLQDDVNERYSLHSFDRNILKLELPRRAERKEPRITLPGQNPEEEERQALSPEAWRIQFENLWPGARGT